jgi:DNA-binding transcriptional MerR regulator
VDGDTIRGNDADNLRGVEAPSGWTSTKQAAKALGVSPRTIRWHIEQGNLVAKPEGEGVRRSWLVSIDSVQAFRDSRQSAGEMPRSNRTFQEGSEIAAESLGNPIRTLADRLAEEAARAAEYRVRLELTEQAQSSLGEELVAEQLRREQAERERDELRLLLEGRSELLLEGRSEAAGAPETPAEEPGRGSTSDEQQPSSSEAPERKRSWWREFFGLE